MAEREDELRRTQAERVSECELLIRRVFCARRALVFDAMTRAELVRRWWAPKTLGVELYECQMDTRVGGSYRYVFGKPGAPPMAFSGVFTEVVPNERVVYTQIFEPMRQAGEGLITAVYEDYEGGYTLLTQRERYPSKQVLDGALASGMEKGMRETFEQLAALVEGM